MGKILGIDYGEVRTGLAITDQLQIITSPYKTLKSKSIKDLINKLDKIAQSENIEKIVVGLPIGTSGKNTKRTNITLNFIKKLKHHFNISIETVDERYSSDEAKELLIEQGIKTGHSKELIDKTAAAIILRRYLDEQQSINKQN